MLTRERLEAIARELPEVQPTNFMKIVNDSGAGIGFALKLLFSASNNQLSAGELSEAMCVSTARVAVLLRKMENKGLVVKREDKSDARVTIVKLSEEGKRVATEMKENMLNYIADIIDKVGEEKFLQFIALSHEIKDAMGEEFPPKPM